MSRGRLLRSASGLLLLGVLSYVTVRSHGQYCLPIFSGAGSDAGSGLDPYLMREGRPDLFKYAPIWAVIFVPLHQLGLALPRVLFQISWVLLNFGAFFFGSALYLRRIPGADAITRLRLALLFVLLTPLALNNAFYGQINSLLWLLIAIALHGSSSRASTRGAFAGGFCLVLAAWMKLFPALFAVFLVWPIDRTLPQNRRAARAGALFALLAGLVLPLLAWRGSAGQVFSSWVGVLAHDVHAPHLKIGLASLLPESLRGALVFAQVIFFGAVLGLVFRTARREARNENHCENRRDRAAAREAPPEEGNPVRPLFESLLMVGVLLLSHMTEPPTLALLAPAALWIAARGRRLEQAGLVVLLVLLPSDLVPRAWKEALGGQYAIKTVALLWVLGVLSLRVWRGAALRSSGPRAPAGASRPSQA